MVTLNDFERRATLLLHDDGIPAGEIALTLHAVRSYGRKAVTEPQQFTDHAYEFRDIRRAVFECIRHNAGH